MHIFFNYFPYSRHFIAVFICTQNLKNIFLFALVCSHRRWEKYCIFAGCDGGADENRFFTFYLFYFMRTLLYASVSERKAARRFAFMASTALLALLIGIGDFRWGTTLPAFAQENADKANNAHALGSNLKSKRRAGLTKTPTNAALFSLSDEQTTQAVRQGYAGRVVLPVGKEETAYRASSPNASKQSALEKRTIVGEASFAANGTLIRFQGNLGKVRNVLHENYSMRFLKRSDEELASEKAEQADVNRQAVVREFRSLLATSGILKRLAAPEEELTVISANKDELGFQHIRFEQEYKGLRIYGQDIYVHANPQQEVFLVHGSYLPTPKAINVTPTLTTKDAIEASNNALRAAGEWGEIPAETAALLGYKGPTTELLIYPHQNSRREPSLRLAYAVTVCPRLSESWMYFIDAQTGETLNRLQLHRYDNSSVKNPAKSVKPDAKSPRQAEEFGKVSPSIQNDKGGAETHSTGFVDVAGGQDLLMRPQTVRGWRDPNGVIYPLSDEGNYRATALDRLPRRPNGGHLVLDATGVDGDNLGSTELALKTTRDGQPFPPEITTALATTDSVLRFFRLRFNQTSWDGKGSFIQTIINIAGGQPGQAWWNPSLVAQGYGPGDPDEGGPGWRDIHLVGHEVGHAYNSAGRLDYGNDQGGAIEEHYANFWGWMVANTYFVFPVLWGTNPQENSAAWHMSAEPDSCGEGNRTLPRSMADFLTRTDPRAQGRQFPHQNGPIVDRAAWNFVRKYGNDTTSRIWYRALNNYLTQQTQFGAFRTALVQAATDLFPNDAALIGDLNAAFQSVGITPETGLDEARRVAFSGKIQAETQAARSVVAFTTNSGRIGIYDVQTRRATLFTGNEVVARTQGGRSQLSAPRTGGKLYFVNTQGRLAFIDLATNRVSVFPNLFIRSAGDIVSATISPDERNVAMISQYDNDPAIYVASLAGATATGAVQRIPLERLAVNGTGGRRESKTEGKQLAGIRFPDALAWSPDAAEPELVLDALSSLVAGRDTIDFWAIYTVGLRNRQSPAIDEVYPPQPDYNLGYPTFGSLNPNTIAFGDTYENETDIYVANFDKPEDIGALKIPEFTLGGRKINDADQATFSPDERQLALVSPSRPNSLLIYTFAQGSAPATFQEITLDSTVNRPFWANLNVATSVADDARNADVFAFKIAPNPAQEQSFAQFVLAKPETVNLKLYTVLGQEIASIYTGAMAQGSYSLPLQTDALPAGVYICRLQIGETVATRRVSVVR